MACFIVPAAEAVLVTALEKLVKSGEERGKFPHAAASAFNRKLRSLSCMLWGGSALLAFEHLWHGEVVPWPPFLTAAADPESAAAMLAEMSSAGVAMAALVTIFWAGMMLGSAVIVKRKPWDVFSRSERSRL